MLLEKPEADRPPALFDRAALLASVGGNIALLRELIQLSLDSDAPRLMTELREAAAKRDPPALEAAGHGLRGLLGELRAHPAAELARQLEAAGQSGNLTNVDARVAVLLSELEPLKHQLRQFAESPNIS
jgi:HPt (histidine-containing phosphotransfer) domain-containing protein